MTIKDGMTTKAPGKKASETKANASRPPQGNYRRVTDGVEVVRRTFDLPETLDYRLGLYAAQRRTTKVVILREVLEKGVPPLDALVAPPQSKKRQPAAQDA